MIIDKDYVQQKYDKLISFDRNDLSCSTNTGGSQPPLGLRSDGTVTRN